MTYGRVGRGAVPVLLAWWDPHIVAGADLTDRAAPGLHAAAPSEDVQGLAERMRMPRRTRARLEAHARGTDAAGAGASMMGSCHTVPVKASAGARRVGTDPQGLMSIVTSTNSTGALRSRAADGSVHRVSEPLDNRVDGDIVHDERRRQQHVVAALPVDGATHRVDHESALHRLRP